MLLCLTMTMTILVCQCRKSLTVFEQSLFLFLPAAARDVSLGSEGKGRDVWKMA